MQCSVSFSIVSFHFELYNNNSFKNLLYFQFYKYNIRDIMRSWIYIVQYICSRHIETDKLISSYKKLSSFILIKLIQFILYKFIQYQFLQKKIQFYAIKLKGSYRKVLCITYAKVKGSYALVSIKKQRNTESLCQLSSVI